jgi:hypothetical protein
MGQVDIALNITNFQHRNGFKQTALMIHCTKIHVIDMLLGCCPGSPCVACAEFDQVLSTASATAFPSALVHLQQMQWELTQLRALTRRQIASTVVFVFALLVSVGFGGLWMLLVRAVVLGPFIIYRAKYQPQNESSENLEEKAGTESSRAGTSSLRRLEACFGKGVGSHFYVLRG